MHDDAQIGFLTVVQVEESAWDGAYLVTDLRGNPSRFCRTSAPVRLDRLQKILHGNGMRRYVYADLIGKSLVEQDGRDVAALIVDAPELLSLRELVGAPLGLWRDARLEPHERFPEDREGLDHIAERLDLVDGPLEVFDRLREALCEPIDEEPEMA